MSSLDAQKVYVGNLNRATTKEALGAFFGPTATEVEIARIRKYGWVTFSSPAAAAEAVKKDGVVLDERPLSIKPYVAPEPRAPRAPREVAAVGGGARTGTGPSPRKVSVVGLPAEINEEAVRSIFEKYGDVEQITLNKKLRNDKTATVVLFVTSQSATASLILDNATVNGQKVSVRLVPVRVRGPRRRSNAGAAPSAPAATRAPRTRAPAAVAGGGRAAGGVSGGVPRAPVPAVEDTVAVLGLVDTPPETIAEHFGDCGEIESIRFVGRGTVALVKFLDAASAKKGLGLNGTSIGGTAITVEAARGKPARAPRAPRAAGGAAGAGAPRTRSAPAATGVAASSGPRPPRRGDPSSPDAKQTVWLGSLPAGTTEADITTALARFGKTTKVFLGKERPFAFVTFETESGAKSAAAAGTVTIKDASVPIEGQRGRVYVGGLPADTTEAAVAAALGKFGATVSVIVNGFSAFVVFESASGASAALAAGVVSIGGSDARIEAPRPRRSRGPRVVA